ncbi:Uncharacterised protein [Shigella sonnei]|nr:Uncharacterised protein [Shigella sonnei]
MYLEGAFSARPAATQIVMRRQFKAETTVQRRIAQRHHCGIAELIKRIESFIDQLACQPLSTVFFINRQRCHADPLQVFALHINRTKCHIANDLTFVICRHQPQRQKAIFTQIVNQLRFRITFE